MKKYISLILLIMFIPFCVNAKEINITAYSYGTSSPDHLNDIVVSSDGSYVVVGYNCEEYDLTRPMDYNENNQNGLIIKYDHEGNIIWKKIYDGNSKDGFISIVEVDDGYIVVGASESDNISSISNNGYADAIIVKYDKNGNIVWQKNYGGNDEDYYNDVVVLNNNEIIAAGVTASTDIDGITNKGTMDIIIVKYDSNGNIIWQKSYGGSGFDSQYGLEIDNGNIVISGSTDSNDIDGLSNVNSTDGLMLKYDKDGNLLWSKNFGGSSGEFYDGLTVTTDGYYIALGEKGSTDIEGITHNGDSDSLIVKYDTKGNIIWKKNFGGEGFDWLMSAVSTNDGGFIAVGNYGSQNIEGIENKGISDGIVIKYDKDGNIEWYQTYGGSFADGFVNVEISPNGEIFVVGSSNSEDIEGIENKGNFDAIILKLEISYDLEKETDTIKNGTYDIKQVGQRAEISINPDNGYELDNIVVKDVNGNKLTYYEENGKYYVDLTDDIVVDVKYKQKNILNPNTTGLLMIGEIILLAIILIESMYFLKEPKKNNKKC